MGEAAPPMADKQCKRKANYVIPRVYKELLYDVSFD
jgi:hypothetical protein